MFCAFSFHGNSINNLLSYCGLIDAKIRASDKDLPVLMAELDFFSGPTIKFEMIDVLFLPIFKRHWCALGAKIRPKIFNIIGLLS